MDHIPYDRYKQGYFGKRRKLRVKKIKHQPAKEKDRQRPRKKTNLQDQKFPFHFHGSTMQAMSTYRDCSKGYKSCKTKRKEKVNTAKSKYGTDKLGWHNTQSDTAGLDLQTVHIECCHQQDFARLLTHCNRQPYIMHAPWPCTSPNILGKQALRRPNAHGMLCAISWYCTVRRWNPEEVTVTSVGFIARLACKAAHRPCRVLPGIWRKLLQLLLDITGEHCAVLPQEKPGKTPLHAAMHFTVYLSLTIHKKE